MHIMRKANRHKNIPLQLLRFGYYVFVSSMRINLFLFRDHVLTYFCSLTPPCVQQHACVFGYYNLLLQRLFDFMFQTRVSCTTAEGAKSVQPWAVWPGAYACGNAVRPSAGCAVQTDGCTTIDVNCTSPAVCPESIYRQTIR